MPEKFGQKLLFAVINAVFTLVVLFIILAVTNQGAKADVIYVDKQDAAIKENVDQRFDDHEKIHAITDKYLERIMDYWDIQYEDLKDEK